MSSAEEYHRRIDEAVKRVERIVERLRESGEIPEFSDDTERKAHAQAGLSRLAELAKGRNKEQAKEEQGA